MGTADFRQYIVLQFNTLLTGNRDRNLPLQIPIYLFICLFIYLFIYSFIYSYLIANTPECYFRLTVEPVCKSAVANRFFRSLP